MSEVLEKILASRENMRFAYFRALEKTPSKESALFFISDRKDTKSFFFFDDQEEWLTLVAILPFEDYLFIDCDPLPTNRIQDVTQIYERYKNISFHGIDRYEFITTMNVIIAPYTILFFGTVEQFISSNSDSTKEFLNESGWCEKMEIIQLLQYMRTYNE